MAKPARRIPMVGDSRSESTDLLSTFRADVERRWPGAEVVAKRTGASVPESPSRKKMTLRELAEFVGGLVARCVPVDRGFSGQTTLMMGPPDAESLKQAAAALETLAPYANAIRRLVAQGQKDDE